MTITGKSSVVQDSENSQSATRRLRNVGAAICLWRGGASLRQALFVMLMMTARPAWSAETALPITPAGGTDISQAIMAPAGLYASAAVIPLNENSKFLGFDGKPVAPERNIKFSIPLMAVGLSYVYPSKILGGSVSSSVQVPFYDLSYTLGTTATGHEKGMADLYADLFYWSRTVTPGSAQPLAQKPRLNVAFGFAMKMPTGKYDVQNPVNIGSNLWLFIPNAAVTYTGQGLLPGAASSELSAKVFYGIPLRNRTTHYRSGHVMTVDFAGTQLVGHVRFGMAGTYSRQITEDNVPGRPEPAHGGKGDAVQIGPVVAYAIPGTKAAVKLKFLQEILAHNKVANHFLAIGVGFKL